MQLDLLNGGLEDPTVGEYVPTPAWVVRDLLQTPGVSVPHRGSSLRILDACAGMGLIGMELERLAVEGAADEGETRMRRPQITAVEAHPGRLERCPEHWQRECAGVVEWCEQAQRDGRVFDLAICNPPFSMYFEIADALLKVRRPADGHVWMVGPWEYVARVSRSAWWDAHPPEWVLRLKKRPWPAVVRECCWVGWAPRTTMTKLRRAGR